MWPARADIGSASKACLIPHGWCLLTRLRPAPTWGRAPRGVRLIGRVPLGAWQTITFVAALRHNRMTARMVINGAMSGETFLAYVDAWF